MNGNSFEGHLFSVKQGALKNSCCENASNVEPAHHSAEKNLTISRIIQISKITRAPTFQDHESMVTQSQSFQVKPTELSLTGLMNTATWLEQ